MFGGQGDDDLNSGLGRDHLTGGKGADIYDLEFKSPWNYADGS